MRVTLREIEDAEEQICALKRNYLRRRGWDERCDNPASLWLWSGVLPDGRAVLCGIDTAFALASAASPDDDESEG